MPSLHVQVTTGQPPTLEELQVCAGACVSCHCSLLLICAPAGWLQWFRNLDGGRGVDVEPLTRADTLVRSVSMILLY